MNRTMKGQRLLKVCCFVFLGIKYESEYRHFLKKKRSHRREEHPLSGMILQGIEVVVI